MQYEWLTRNARKELIIFFNGWGMDKQSIARLGQGNCEFDCLHFFDYRDSSLPDFNFSDYEKIYLIAWSMGVYMSNCLTLRLAIPFARKIAFCGTGNPIDLYEGIAPKICNLTIRNFSEQSKQIFSEKIGFAMPEKRSAKSLKEELAAIASADLPKNTDFDTAFIALDDEIFPPQAQCAYWKKHAKNLIYLQSKHYPFNHFSDWKELLRCRTFTD